MKINIVLDVEKRLGDPLIKITIDDYMLLYEGVAQEQFEFDVLLEDGHHEIKITHYGKTIHHHQLDDNGKIVIDRHVEILGIALDEVVLKDELWSGRFFPVYLHKADHEPYFICPNLYLGHNGTWIMEFSTPAIQWLINCRKPGPDLNNTIFKSGHDVLLQMKSKFTDFPDV